MAKVWKILRVVVEVPVENGASPAPFGETDLRYLVERLVASQIHREINRNRMTPIATGRVRVKMWSKVKQWL